MIDGGLIFLLILLVVYGFYSWYTGLKRGIRVFSSLMIEMKMFRSEEEMHLRIQQHLKDLD